MTICQVPGCEEHFACRMRAKGVQVDPRATPSRSADRPYKMRRPDDVNHNSWERGIAYEERPGGYRMPIYKPNGDPMRIKEASSKRHELKERRARMNAAAAARQPGS